MPLGDMLPIAPGNRVSCTGEPFRVNVSPLLRGRVLDALGEPLDDRSEIPASEKHPVHAIAPHPLRRKDIEEP
jgi:flagellar biosynthesis/type III secretory pathway ATPase